MKWMWFLVLLTGCNRYWVSEADWRARGGVAVRSRAVCAERVADDSTAYLRADARLWRRGETRGGQRQVAAWSHNADIAAGFVPVGLVLTGVGAGLFGWSLTHPPAASEGVSPLFVGGVFAFGVGLPFLLVGTVLGGIAAGTRDHEAPPDVADQVCRPARTAIR